MPPVSVLIKPASGMCNLNCDYCFYCDETARREQASFGFMTEETLKNVIRKTLLNADTAIHYMFQGGEPTLAGIPFFEKVLDYQIQYNKKNIPIYNAIQTNGTLLDEKWCRFLHEHHFLVGLSVDGTKKIHDSLRHDRMGGPTFEKVRSAARLMDQFRVDYNILTVVTSAIAGELPAIYAYYKKQGWLYQQYIACLDPLNETHGLTPPGEAHGLAPYALTPPSEAHGLAPCTLTPPSEAHGLAPYALTPTVYGRFLIDLFQLWYRDVKSGHAPYNRQFENYISIAAGHLPASCDQCGVCSIQYVTEANGNVYPCDFYMLDEYLLGNFNENSFSQINEKRRELQFVERSYLLSDECRTCKYHWLCKGGCQRNRDYNPKLHAYENYFCESYRMFFDACLDQIMELAKK